MTRDAVDALSYKIIGGAIEVHKHLGPGLLESIYHKCLRHELIGLGLAVDSQREVPLEYKGLHLNAELRCDLIVNDLVVVELKAVESLVPVYTAQLLSYMRLLELPKGILVNFHCTNIFKEGQKTFVNELYRKLPP